MPKIPYKPEKTGDEDDDYEIVSFEDFCDKSPGSKTDLLTLNDNINYRLYYENDKSTNFEKGETSCKDIDEQKETSLSGMKDAKRKGSTSFAPFGRYNPNAHKGSLFGSVIPKPRDSKEPNREHRSNYQRFSSQGSTYQLLSENCQRFGSTMLLLSFILALSVGVWWAVCGAVGAGGDRHYRKLLERAHPGDPHATAAAAAAAAVVVDGTALDKPLSEHHYHDHNNLSTKNKNSTDKSKKKPELYKKSSTFTERPAGSLAALCSLVPPLQRFDCYPQDGANEEACVKRGCCWNSTEDGYGVPVGRPYCFYPPQYDSHHFVNMTENRHGLTVFYEKLRPSGYPDDFELVRIDFKYLSNDIVQIKITDALNKRFEPPYPETPVMPGPISRLKYRVVVDSSAIGFKLIRNEDNVTILDTQGIGGMILSDKFLQISTLLPTNKLYGFGERRASFQVDMNWQTFTMFNFDSPPLDNTNLYGSHPFYLALENNGKSHGMVLLNSNAMDVVVQPAPAVTYRTIGGVLNLVVMLGPSPGEVVSQYTEVVGRPHMPPYWALGFHLCKYNYGSLNVTRDVWERNRNAGIPFDAQWNDLDYMEEAKDFTYDKQKYAGLPQFVEKLHASGMHYVVLIDPGISASEKAGEYPPWDRGLELDIFIKNSTNQPFIGKVWNKKTTAWPDFTHPNAAAYWLEMLSSLHKQIAFDGAWIDMNEPSNFVSGALVGSCSPESLPYRPRGVGPDGLRTKTLCMDATHHAGDHYHWHNLHALTEAIATRFAMTEIRGRRPLVITRSSWIGVGQYAGHWSGDVASTWDDMRMSIPVLLSFSLFGVPLMGSDICGFRGDVDAPLCTRWTQLGAFYPFARNHNSDTSTPQDPVSLGETVVKAARDSLRLRYSLLPHYYYWSWRAHRYGDTLARPLFFEFPQDPVTHGIDTQFLIGPNVMIAPILKPNTTTVEAYLPGEEPWLVIATEQLVPSKNTTLNENGTVLMRSGSIIPIQRPPRSGPVTTTNTRSGPLQLIVLRDSLLRATGYLYWDDGDSINSYEEKKYSHIEFTASATSVTSSVHWWGHGVPSINNITIYNIDYPIKTLKLNDKLCKRPLCEYAYDSNSLTLRVYNMNLSLDKPFVLSWAKNAHFDGKHTSFGVTNDTAYVCKDDDCTEFEKR